MCLCVHTASGLYVSVEFVLFPRPLSLVHSCVRQRSTSYLSLSDSTIAYTVPIACLSVCAEYFTVPTPGIQLLLTEKEEGVFLINLLTMQFQ